MARLFGNLILILIFLTTVVSSTFASRNFSKIDKNHTTLVPLESAQANGIHPFHASSSHAGSENNPPTEATDEKSNESDTSKVSKDDIEKYILADREMLLPESSIALLRLVFFHVHNVVPCPPEKPPRLYS